MKFLLAVLILIVSHAVVYSQACCCTGASYCILPNLNRHVLGLRSSFRSYQPVTTSLNPELDGNIVNLLPPIGLNCEHQFENRLKGNLLSYTGGDFATGTIAFDVYYKALTFLSSFSPAAMNDLNWNGENRNRFNFEAGVFYNFSTKTKS